MRDSEGEGDNAKTAKQITTKSDGLKHTKQSLQRADSLYLIVPRYPTQSEPTQTPIPQAKSYTAILSNIPIKNPGQEAVWKIVLPLHSAHSRCLPAAQIWRFFAVDNPNPARARREDLMYKPLDGAVTPASDLLRS